MKSIVAKMTAKGQITVPKTIRDWLEVDSTSSIKFDMVRSGVVEMQKHVDMDKCPFCNGEGQEPTYDGVCKVCEGQGEIESFNQSSLSTLFCSFCVAHEQSFTITYDKQQPFPLYHLTNEDVPDNLIYYRDVFQLEAVKLFILNDDIANVDVDSIANIFLLKQHQEIIRHKLKFLTSK